MRQPLVERLATVDGYFMNRALSELRTIDWATIGQDEVRRRSGVFGTSTAIPLRVHDTNRTDLTVLEYGEIVECRNTQNFNTLPALAILAGWAYQKVKGLHMGRIQCVRLEAGGDVGLHIDPGTYFQVHDRLHIPLITDEGTIFFDDLGNEARMPHGGLYRLNNRDLHGVRNESTNPRVHLIIDIQTKEHPWKSA